MLSASSTGPYMPPMPMQPRAIGNTRGPFTPSCRSSVWVGMLMGSTMPPVVRDDLHRLVRFGEKFTGRMVAEPEPAREPWILWTGTDVDAPGRVELVAVYEHDAEARQWLPAPASRRARRVRAVLDLDFQPEQLLHPPETRFDLGRGHRLVGDLWMPRESQHPPTIGPIGAQNFAP